MIPSFERARGREGRRLASSRGRGLILWFCGLSLLGACRGSSRRPFDLVKAGLITIATPPETDAVPPKPPSVREPVFPYLDAEPSDRALSVGDTSSGRVVHAKELVESDSIGILPKQRERDLKYGTEELVNLLQDAGKSLHDETSTKLWIGNIGKRGGGDIPFSVSHNAGRDADVALSYLDAANNPIDPPGLVALGKDGFSKDRSVQLDAKRTWITVRALVTDEGSDVEYIFLSDPLRKKLLTWGRDHGAKPSVCERVANVLRQPAGAAPHDDHLHVRIYCSAIDLSAGCVDTGTERPLVAARVQARSEKVREAVAALGAEDPSLRARAVLRLALLDETEKLSLITKLSDDPSPNVRHAVVTAIARLGHEENAAGLARRFAMETDPAVRERIVLAAAVLGGARGGEILERAIETAEPEAEEVTSSARGALHPIDVRLAVDLLDGECLAMPLEQRGCSVRAYAVAVAGRADRLEPVPGLVALLVSPDASLRAAAAESLALITNHRFGDAWTDDAATAPHREAQKRYEDLWKKLQKSPRTAWIALGFAASGFKVRSFDQKSVWELVRATAAESHLSYNAREMLARIADEPSASVTWPADEACAYYLRIFQQRRRFHLDKPPVLVARTCAALKIRE